MYTFRRQGRFAAAAGFFLAAESAADFRLDVPIFVGNPAIRTVAAAKGFSCSKDVETADDNPCRTLFCSAMALSTAHPCVD